MATKNTKSVGDILGQSKPYWLHAAKQFIWPVDFELLHICVPEKDLEAASDDLMVKHFIARGWKINTVNGSVSETKVYNAPVTNGKPMFAPTKADAKEEHKPGQFMTGQRFAIKSTGCELEINHIDTRSPVKIHLKYTNRNKHDFIASPEQLNKSLKMEVWVAI